MPTYHNLKLNMAWIRLLSFAGVVPIQINVKTGRFENCGSSRKLLYCSYWTLVQVQIIYFVWKTYWKIKMDPGSSVHQLPIYNLFVVASLVGTFSSFSYFILQPEAFIIVLNESISLQCNSSKSKSVKKLRGQGKSRRSNLSVFTKFIPIIHFVSATCSIIALKFISWPAMCGPTPLLLCPLSYLQGLSITISLAWCYFGVLVQTLFMCRVTDRLAKQIRYAR